MGGLKDHWKILRKQGLECDLSLKEIFKIWLLFETKLQGMCGEKAMVIVWGRGGGQRVERELPCEWISPSLPGISPQPSATAQPSSLPLAVSVWGAITPASSLASCFSPLEAPTSHDAEALWALALSPASQAHNFRTSHTDLCLAAPVTELWELQVSATCFPLPKLPFHPPLLRSFLTITQRKSSPFAKNKPCPAPGQAPPSLRASLHRPRRPHFANEKTKAQRGKGPSHAARRSQRGRRDLHPRTSTPKSQTSFLCECLVT